MMTSHHSLMLAAMAAIALPVAASAQSVPYGNVSGNGDEASSTTTRGGSSRSRGNGQPRQKRSEVTPYIEVLQIVDAELSPGSEVLTYTGVAAGIDGTVVGRNSALSASVRYERRFGWGKAQDHDLVSGVAKGYTAVVPGVSVEAGGAAFVSQVDGTGATRVAGFSQSDSSRNVYSAYAGPVVKTAVGDVTVDASYRIGYTRVERSDKVATPIGIEPVDLFDDSVVHNAEVHAGVKPDDVLPVGLGVGGGWYREDISNLDQRVEDLHARADVTIPVSPTIALVGGVGWEDVEISSRDAARDANGNPIVGRGGNYVTDKSEPRILAYDVSGLIWDAGVVWRPSRRTALEAHVGRRYGSTSVYGTFGYRPGSSSLSIAVYDNVAGFGGQMNRALIGLPAEFSVVRNPISGSFNGCVTSLETGSCLNSAIGSMRSATFRARGVMANYSYDFGRFSAGAAAGYDRRKFIGARGTVLEAYNGIVDENYWMTAYLSGRLDERSYFTTSAYAGWYDPGNSGGSDTTTLGAAAQYSRLLTGRLSATAAVAVDGYKQPDLIEDQWDASAMLGVRYSF